MSVPSVPPSAKPNNNIARPLLKWAGGKTQLLPDLLASVPTRFNRYIEPFFGGGALFFALEPEESIIADINPELINLYRTVGSDVERVIEELHQHKNTQESFYEVRSLDWRELDAAAAAARTIYLNRTCFNGLYRVNKSGGFNVPFANYKNPKIVDEANLRRAAVVLSKARIIEGDYLTVLQSEAKQGDFVFLDPPYLPISVNSDFKRYTKEQFHEDDHRRLAIEVKRLSQLGCHVVLTNSNHPLVHELYSEYDIRILSTKRNINSHGNKRTGEDALIVAPAARRFTPELVLREVSEQARKFPTTRYMGSKNKLLSALSAAANQFEFDTFVDLFGGTGIVSYLFKSEGKRVITNDYMAMSTTFAKAMIENNGTLLGRELALDLVDNVKDNDGFVRNTFRGLYFTDEENQLIDSLRVGIAEIRNPYKRAIAMSALIRTCLKKRPRGIFTYVGNRYDDGRKDLSTSFREHFLDAADAINSSIFDNGRSNKSRNGDALTVGSVKDSLVYMDPPYYSPLSDNEYVRRYHFVEGLAKDWDGLEIQANTVTKKFKNYPTPFSTRVGAESAFDALFRRHRNSILMVSYSSNSLPGPEQMMEIMRRYKKNVDVIPVDYKYSFGNQNHKVGENNNSVQEFIFMGY